MHNKIYHFNHFECKTQRHSILNYAATSSSLPDIFHHSVLKLRIHY